MGWSHNEMSDCNKCNSKKSSDVWMYGDKGFNGKGKDCVECGYYEGEVSYDGDYWTDDMKEHIKPFTKGFRSIEEVNDIRENILQIHPITDLRKVVK